MYRVVYHVMDISEIKQRLEPALRPAEPPTLEEVLKQVSTHGVLRGPVDWVFPAWMLYVEYATQKIAETFQLSEEERRQLLHFRDTMKQLLLKAWMQTKERLAALYKTVAEGTYRLERRRLYAPDGAWIYINEKTAPKVHIYGISAETYFPDILKLPHKKLELFQLGWRASDEGIIANQPVMSTSQPWQLFAWIAIRPGTLYIYWRCQLNAERSQRDNKYESKRLGTEMEQRRGYRPRYELFQAWRMDTDIYNVARRRRIKAKRYFARQV
jgi:hypothetical protein